MKGWSERGRWEFETGWLVVYNMEMIVNNVEWLMKAEEAASRGREGGYVSDNRDRKLSKLWVLKTDGEVSLL